MMVVWFVIAGGFTQSGFNRPTGTVRLYRKVRAEVRGQERDGLEIHVRWMSWNGDWAALAAEIATTRDWQDDGRCIVVFFGYSFGVGYGAVTFGRALDAEGLAVTVAVFSDGVFRSRLLSLRWLAFWWAKCLRIEPRIKLPSAFWAARIVPFVQEQDAHLRGHPIDNAGKVVPVTRLFHAHSGMDDAPEFHAAALGTVKEVLARAGKVAA